MNIVDPAVRAGWCLLNVPLEGREAHLYLDTEGIPTTGIGCVVPGLPDSLRLPWQNASGTPSTPSEIRAEWLRVTSMRSGLLAARYATSTSPRLSDADVDALALARLEADAAVLVQRWPEFSSFPADAQEGILLLAWAVGPGRTEHGLTGPEWPHLQAAVDARDWTAAAQAGQLDPAYGSRNLRVREAFGSASGFW
jgi:hypothetical protein